MRAHVNAMLTVCQTSCLTSANEIKRRNDNIITSCHVADKTVKLHSLKLHSTPESVHK